MNLLAIDFETQSNDPRTTNVTEVGAAGWFEGGAIDYSQLCWEPSYPPQDPFIADLTGITDEMLTKEGLPRKPAFEKLCQYINQATHIFAHKKAFDQVVFESTCERLGIIYPRRTWICTLTEFEWPKKFTCMKLGHLAFEHGLFDNGRYDRTKCHRASDDAKLLLSLVAEYKLDDVLAYAYSPWRYFKADILPPWKDGGAQKDKAVKLGFSYERCKYTEGPSWPKTWVTRVKEKNVAVLLEASHAAQIDFRIAPIQGIS